LPPYLMDQLFVTFLCPFPSWGHRSV